MIHRILPILLLLIAACPVKTLLAQTVLRGFVRDAETGGIIPDASVQVQGGFQAIVTNADGRFELMVDALPVTLKISRIGYFSQELLADDTAALYQVKLIPANFDLDPVIVTEHESVEDIMRHVIERKKDWRARLQSLTAHGYARFSMENDTDIVFLAEGMADVSWTQRQGWRTVVKSYRRSSNRFVDDNMDDLNTLDELGSDAATINLYDDEIYMLGHHLKGVTSPDALKAYRFELLGQRLMDNRIVYDIGVTPRSRLLTGMVGRISVIDKDYALIEADLQPSASVVFPPPIRTFKLTAKQQFAVFGEGFWLPIGLQIEGMLKAGIVGLVFPKLTMKLTSRVSDYRAIGLPQQALGDSTTSVRPVVTVPVLPPRVLLDPGDSLVQQAMIPLTEREQKAYATIDSSRTFIQAYEPKGFIASILKKQGAFDDKKRSDSASRQPSLSGQRTTGEANQTRRKMMSYRVWPQTRYNRVDGSYAGLSGQAQMNNLRLTVNGSGGYSVAARHWSYGGGFKVRWGKRQRRLFSAQYLKDTATRYPSFYGPEIVGVANLFGQDDYFDYYWNEQLSLNLTTRIGPRGLWVVTGALHLERHRSLPKVTDYTLFGIDHTQRLNPPITPGGLRSLSLNLTFGRLPEPFHARAYRYAAVSAEISHPELLRSDFRFARFHASYARRFSDFLKRRALPLTLDVRFSGSTSLGALPLQRFASLDGSIGPASTMGAFRTLRGRPYEGEHALGVFWEQNFRTVPFELLGWNALVRRGIGMSVYGAHGRPWVTSSANRLALSAFNPIRPKGFHHEIGLSITGLMYLFRLDLTTRLDQPGFYVGLGMGPGFVW